MRLIDADRLKRVLNKNFGGIGGELALEQLIDNQPTVDAVPVVRCGECKYGSPHPIDNASVFCLKGINRHLRMKKHDFCSYGARKDNA